MITERHNFACRLIVKAIEVGSLGGCFVKVDVGSKDRLALLDLQIPDGSDVESTNRSMPAWLFLSRFPFSKRLTASRPNAILVTVTVTEIINQKKKGTICPPSESLK